MKLKQQFLNFWDKLSQTKRIIFAATLAIIVLIVFILIILGIVNYKDSKISVHEAHITNITDTAFTATWISDSRYSGSIYIKEGNGKWPVLFAQSGKKAFYDDRDLELNVSGQYSLVSGGSKPRYTHHITVRNLKPTTLYSLRIGGIINGRDFPNSIITKDVAKSINVPDPAYGLIQNTANDDTFVILTPINTRTFLSQPVAPNGTYSIDINQFNINNSVKSGKQLQAIIYDQDYKPVTYTFTSNGYKPLEKIILNPTHASYSSANSKVLASTADNINSAFVTNLSAAPNAPPSPTALADIAIGKESGWNKTPRVCSPGESVTQCSCGSVCHSVIGAFNNNCPNFCAVENTAHKYTLQDATAAGGTSDSQQSLLFYEIDKNEGACLEINITSTNLKHDALITAMGKAGFTTISCTTSNTYNLLDRSKIAFFKLPPDSVGYYLFNTYTFPSCTGINSPKLAGGPSQWTGNSNRAFCIDNSSSIVYGYCPAGTSPAGNSTTLHSCESSTSAAIVDAIPATTFNVSRYLSHNSNNSGVCTGISSDDLNSLGTNDKNEINNKCKSIDQSPTACYTNNGTEYFREGNVKGTRSQCCSAHSGVAGCEGNSSPPILNHATMLGDIPSAYFSCDNSVYISKETINDSKKIQLNYANDANAIVAVKFGTTLDGIDGGSEGHHVTLCILTPPSATGEDTFVTVAPACLSWDNI